MKKYYYYNLDTKEISETKENWCPIGNGFMVDFKGDYKDYLKHKDQYSLVGATFMKEAEAITDK